MNSRVLLFATIRERAGGRKSIEVTLPDGATVRELKTKILEEFPALEKSMSSVMVAINREFATDETVLDETMEIALFPPVAGG